MSNVPALGQQRNLGPTLTQRWPILSGIPNIGGLFGSADRKANRTELYLFLTPRILKTDADADSITLPRLPHGKGSEWR
jgi:type II secretory pathway component GspD/PulD (secretin)